jgi:hypothetical protein
VVSGQPVIVFDLVTDKAPDYTRSAK